MRAKEAEKRRKVRKERRKDEESLYYILERDLDREAIFREHDGWDSQVSFGNGRIDYVVRYGKDIYGIEVKTGIPKRAHFDQAKEYSDALNGVFLAYPSDRVGEAIFVSEVKEQKYKDVGVISITLFRSHIIRRAERRERRTEDIWKTYHFDEKKYQKYLDEFSWERLDGLPATVLKDGCFWISFAPDGEESEEPRYRIPFNPSEWTGLGLVYAASKAVNLRKLFSLEYLSKINENLGWGQFDLWGWVQCELMNTRSYGDHLWMFGLNLRAHSLLNEIREALKRKLRKKEWKKLSRKIADLKQQHIANQRKHENELIA